jgi:predicted DNA-binding transcriptional regulator YafY
VSWVLEWGARVKVIEPAELVDSVRKELVGALALYPATAVKAETKKKSR